jgi:hypothetical protein
MSGRINWIAVIAAVIVQQIVGFLWYGALFQEPWMNAVGLTAADVESANMPVSMAVSFLASIAAAILLSLLLSATDEWGLMNGLKWAFLLWLLLALPIHVETNIWALRGWIPALIDGSEALVALLAAGAVIGMRRPKHAVLTSLTF